MNMLEEFFLEQYFIHMELKSKDLFNIPMVVGAVKAMHDLDIVHNIPIVAISYSACS